MPQEANPIVSGGGVSRMLVEGKCDRGGHGLGDTGWSGRPSPTGGLGVSKLGTRPVLSVSPCE